MADSPFDLIDLGHPDVVYTHVSDISPLQVRESLQALITPSIASGATTISVDQAERETCGHDIQRFCNRRQSTI